MRLLEAARKHDVRFHHISTGENVRDRPGHDRRYAIDASKLRAELAGRRCTPTSPADCATSSIGMRNTAIGGCRPRRPPRPATARKGSETTAATGGPSAAERRCAADAARA